MTQLKTKQNNKINEKVRNESAELTCFNRRISLRNIPRHGRQQRNPMLRRRNSIRRRRIHHQTPVLRRRRQIHIINPHAGASNDFQPPSTRFKHFSTHFRPAPHNQRITQRDLRAQLLRTQIIRAIHVGEAFEEIEPRLSEFLGDEDGRLGVHRENDEDRVLTAAGERDGGARERREVRGVLP